MKKYLSRIALSCLLLGVFAITACVNAPLPAPGQTVDPRQATINATYNSATALDAAVKAATVAIQSNTLKGQDADRVVSSLVAAKSAVDAALTSLKATAPAAPTTPGAKP